MGVPFRLQHPFNTQRRGRRLTGSAAVKRRHQAVGRDMRTEETIEKAR